MRARLQPLMVSATTEHRTPAGLFAYFNEIYGPFTLDAAASDENHLCTEYFTKERTALREDVPWTGKVWCNPPYGPGIEEWCLHATFSVMRGPAQVVCMLLPARTDTIWWHKFVVYLAQEIFWIKGRVTFGEQKNGAPFPSVVVVWRKHPLSISLSTKEFSNGG